MTWDFHVDDSAKGSYGTILGKDPLTSSGLILIFSDHIIEADDVTLKGSMAPMVDMST